LRRAFDRFSWKLVKDVLNAAAIVTSPTATAASILTRHGVSPPVRVISCGVDTKRFTPRPEHHDGIVAIYVGRLDRDKDVETLVEAIWRCDGVRLVIAGRGRSHDSSIAKSVGRRCRAPAVRSPSVTTSQTLWERTRSSMPRCCKASRASGLVSAANSLSPSIDVG